MYLSRVAHPFYGRPGPLASSENPPLHSSATAETMVATTEEPI